MFQILLTVGLSLGGGPVEPHTYFAQVHPEPRVADILVRSRGQKRAVILIHGLRFTLNKENVPLAHFQDWQEPGSLMVKTLSKEADIFAFGYGQNVPVSRIADNHGLSRAVDRVRALGYPEIMVVGYSAGGVIARQFVEDHPHAGITRLIQVCSPNGGSKLATFPIAVTTQKPFLISLTKEGREETLKTRQGKKLPPDLQCACIVGCGLGSGDGAIYCHDQWTADLQAQGVQAVRLEVLHFQAVHDRKGANCVLDLIRRDLPRWNEREVNEGRKLLAIK